MEQYRRPGISVQCVKYKLNQIKEWTAEQIGMIGLLLFLTVTVSAKNLSMWLTGTAAILVIAFSSNTTAVDFIFSRNYRYEKKLAYALLLMAISITDTVLLLLSYLFLKDINLLNIKGFSDWAFRSLFFIWPITGGSYLFLTSAVSFLFDPLAELVKLKLISRFPISEERLKRCGVKDKKDCMLYYCWVMHYYGKETCALVSPEDIFYHTISEMERVYEQFPDAEPNKMYHEYQDLDYFKIRNKFRTEQERNDYAYWAGCRGRFRDRLKMVNDRYCSPCIENY